MVACTLIVSQVSNMAVRALAVAVEGAGVDRERFLVEAGLARTWLDDGDVWLPLSDYGRVVRAALSTSGDEALGLHMGEQVNTNNFDVLGPLSEHSSCLRDALLMSARYARIVVDGPRLELDEHGVSATLRITLLCGQSPEVRVTAEFATSSLLYLVRRFVGHSAQLRRAFFAYEAPAHRAEYSRVFAGREQFAHAFTGIEFERAWLDRKHLASSPELCALLKGRAELLLARIDQQAPVVERVTRLLASQSLQTKPTMESIARDLGMSARSLRRRLQCEGASCEALIETARATQAKQMLSDPRHSIQEAAYAMGFSTPAAFSRAFKRWTGQPPSVFRSAHSSGRPL